MTSNNVHGNILVYYLYNSPFVIVINSVHWVIKHHLGRLIPDLTRD